VTYDTLKPSGNIIFVFDGIFVSWRKQQVSWRISENNLMLKTFADDTSVQTVLSISALKSNALQTAKRIKIAYYASCRVVPYDDTIILTSILIKLHVV